MSQKIEEIPEWYVTDLHYSTTNASTTVITAYPKSKILLTLAFIHGAPRNIQVSTRILLMRRLILHTSEDEDEDGMNVLELIRSRQD